MIERCSRCIGKKTITALGMIVKKCPECKGVGHIKNIEEKKEEIKDSTPQKQRGRPRKGNHERKET